MAVDGAVRRLLVPVSQCVVGHCICTGEGKGEPEHVRCHGIRELRAGTVVLGVGDAWEREGALQLACSKRWHVRVDLATVCSTVLAQRVALLR